MEGIERHNDEIQLNVGFWAGKPLLARVYGALYQRIASQIDRSIDGEIVEIGSGMGNIKRWIPDCVTTDLFANPQIDRVENIYKLSCKPGAISNAILFDVFHHLKYPVAALQELRRVLAPGGRVIVLEPDISAIGYLVYGCFHPEPVSLRSPISLEPKAGDDALCYFAAQGNAYRLFRRREAPAIFDGWDIHDIRRLVDLAYVGSGGFSGPQLYPEALLPMVRFLERIAGILPELFSTRLLVVLTKK